MQIPAEAQQVALSHYDSCPDEEIFNALCSLTRAAAANISSIQRQLQQERRDRCLEVLRLQAAMSRQQKEHRAEQEQMQQLVGELQGTVAGLVAQMQAMQQQLLALQR